MYAIVFDLDADVLRQVYPGRSWSEAFADVRTFLEDRGFDRRRGCVYFGDDAVKEVSCILAVQDLNEEFQWFAPSVRDIRLLRIGSNEDLMPAIDRVARPQRRRCR